MGRCWDAKGGLSGGAMCRLELLENKLGKGVHADIPGGVRARVECDVDHFGTSDGEN